MDEEAKFDLEKRIDLYKFYSDLFTKGIVIFVAIATFVFKAALDDTVHRKDLAVGGGIATIAILFPLVFAIHYESKMRDEFRTLAIKTHTTPISTWPLRATIISTGCFWILVTIACVFLYRP